MYVIQQQHNVSLSSPAVMMFPSNKKNKKEARVSSPICSQRTQKDASSGFQNRKGGGMGFPPVQNTSRGRAYFEKGPGRSTIYGMGRDEEEAKRGMWKGTGVDFTIFCNFLVGGRGRDECIAREEGSFFHDTFSSCPVLLVSARKK